MQRLQAKLVLKGLFLLSLEGEGTTAGEIGAAMLIYDENDPQKAVKSVEELLENFCRFVPERYSADYYRRQRNQYSLKVSSKDNLNNALTEAVKTVSPDVVPKSSAARGA